MRGSRQRVLHIIRHAESELNVVSAHANAGYFEGVTGLDSKLSERGHEQAKALGTRILMESSNDPYLLKQAQLVVTSPLSRAILTAKHAMPFEKYSDKYKVKHFIAEQVENTTDIGHHKHRLSKMYPELSHEFMNLPDAWWWRHPSRRHSEIDINPEHDAKLLVKHRGKSPASESKHSLRARSLEFIKWLYSDDIVGPPSTRNAIFAAKNEFENSLKEETKEKVLKQKHKNNKSKIEVKRVKDLFNIAAFSHACTIRELELLLLTLNGLISEKDASDWSKDDTIRENVEQITFDLPFDARDVDWELLKYRVEQARHVPNHADLDDIDDTGVSQQQVAQI